MWQLRLASKQCTHSMPVSLVFCTRVNQYNHCPGSLYNCVLHHAKTRKKVDVKKRRVHIWAGASPLDGDSEGAKVEDLRTVHPPSITVAFTMRVHQVCQLTIKGDIGDFTSIRAATSIIALYHHYLNRSRTLVSAAKQLLANTESNNSRLQALKQRLKEDVPDEDGLKVLDSMEILLALCQQADPGVASSIENEIKYEYTKTQTERRNARDNDFVIKFTEWNGSAEDPKIVASSIVRSKLWEAWKTRLRTAIIDNYNHTNKIIQNDNNEHNDKDNNNSAPSYAVTFGVESRSADDLPMTITLEACASSPSLSSIVSSGPEDPAIKSFLLLELQQCPESQMFEALTALCWKACRLHHPSSFDIVFPDLRKEGDDDEAYVVVNGKNEEELKIFMMVLAGFEGEEFPFLSGMRSRRSESLWMPSDGRLQLRKRPIKNNSTKGVYELRCDNGVATALSRREVNGLMDCLDAFCELHPAWGLLMPPMMS